MRPRYGTPSIVLARYGTAEASALLYLLTEDFGLVKARAQGVRKSGAKLASAVKTLSECDAVLIRAKDGWRLSGAVLGYDWFGALNQSARRRAGRVSGLLLRLVRGETVDPALFILFKDFLQALTTCSEEAGDAAEHIVALRLLSVLGLDAGDIPGGYDGYTPQTLADTLAQKRELTIRINRGIEASGL